MCVRTSVCVCVCVSVCVSCVCVSVHVFVRVCACVLLCTHSSLSVLYDIFLSLESRFDDMELNELLDDLKTHINYQY